MTEWHLTPEYILDNWTEELLALMFEKRKESFDAMRTLQQPDSESLPAKRVTDLELFTMPGVSYRRVN